MKTRPVLPPARVWDDLIDATVMNVGIYAFSSHLRAEILTVTLRSRLYELRMGFVRPTRVPWKALFYAEYCKLSHRN